MVVVRRVKTNGTKSTPVVKTPPAQPKLSGLLADATNAIVRLPISMVLYGAPGFGKSSFAAHSPSPLFLIHPKERGIKRLMEKKKVPSTVFHREVETWDDKLKILDELATTKHPFKTVVEDSLIWVEQQIFQACCNDLFNGDWSSHGFYDHWAGPIEAQSAYWPLYLDRLNALHDVGIATILIGHARTKSVNNPSGADYVKWVPELEERSWGPISAWADMILFVERQISVEKDSKRARGKASDGGLFMNCEGSAIYEAKSKGLPPIIDMGSSGAEAWNNFIEAYNGIGK